MSNLRLSFGKRIKELRKKKGYKTQDAFAEGFHVSLATVRNWEQGKRLPEIDVCLQLCDFFACDLDYLFGRIDEKTHDLHSICEKTGLSESSALSIMEEPEIAEAINSLDRNELLTFANALNNAIDQIFESDSLLERADPAERWRIGIQQQNMELAVFKFREICWNLINRWVNVDAISSSMKKAEEAYLREVAEKEEQRKKKQKEAAEKPPLTEQEMEQQFQQYLEALNRMEEGSNG